MRSERVGVESLAHLGHAGAFFPDAVDVTEHLEDVRLELRGR